MATKHVKMIKVAGCDDCPFQSTDNEHGSFCNISDDGLSADDDERPSACPLEDEVVMVGV